MMEWHEGAYWGIGFGGFWMVLFWAAAIAFIVWVVKKLTERSNAHVDIISTAIPLDIAKERYAKGEITQEEFLQLKKDLTK
jgi:putative membrane protein